METPRWAWTKHHGALEISPRCFRNFTTVPAPLHHGGVFTAPRWSFYGTTVEWHRHRGVFPDFTMVEFFLHHGVFPKKYSGLNSPWWRTFELQMEAFDFGLEAFRPDDEVLSKCCKNLAPPQWSCLLTAWSFYIKKTSAFCARKSFEKNDSYLTTLGAGPLNFSGKSCSITLKDSSMVRLISSTPRATGKIGL